MSSAGCEGGEVGSEGAVELAGDEAFEAADDFFLGLAFCEAAVHVAASSFAVAEPDEDDYVQGSVGCAVAGEVEPVTAGPPARRGDRRGSAQVSEGRLGAEPVDVLARDDEQGRGVVSAASETGHRRGRRGGDQLVEAALQIGGLGAEAGNATPQSAQRRPGGLGGIGEAVGVGPQSGAHGRLGLEGPSGVELLAQRGMGSDEQVAELAQRGGSGLDSAVSGDAELADRLDDSGGVLGGCGRFAREHLARSGLGVDGVVLAATRAQMRMRLVDLDHSATPLDQRSGQGRAERSGGLDTDRGDLAERREPCVGQAVTGTGRRERLRAHNPAQRVERGDDMEVGVAVNPTDHRLVLIWHADVLHLEAARVPGRDGHNSDEASVGAGS